MKTMRKLIVLFLLASPCFAQTPVTIQNPSFETPAGSWIPWDGGQYAGSAANWVIADPNHFCIWQPTSDYFTTLPAGLTIACLDADSASQDLGQAVAINSTYVLTVAIGQRLDGLNNNYTLALNAGSTQVCAKSGSNSTITPGTFSDVWLTCLTGASVATGDLTVVLTSAGRQLEFDNVRLTVQSNISQMPQHQAALTWADSTNPPGTQYRVYRSTGTCSNPIFSLLVTVTTLGYTDTTITAQQNYCYDVTSFDGVTESIAGALVFIPGSVTTITVQ
jgi:hypothetical protein